MDFNIVVYVLKVSLCNQHFTELFLLFLQLCFAYRGRIKNTISFLISYTDKSGRDKQSSRSYEFVPILDDKWHWLCMNVYDKVLNDRQLSSSADERFKMYVERITVGRDSGSDLFIDDLYIWRDAVSGRFPFRNCKHGCL